MIKFNLFKSNIAISAILAMSLTGCGDSNSSSEEISKVSILSDSAIEGISYKCTTNNQEGITNKKGEFKYLSTCDNINFKIGNILLGSINPQNIQSDNIIYPTDILGTSRDDTKNDSVIRILQLIQSLDEDNNPNNGIKISEEMQKKLSSQNINFSKITDTQLKQIVESVDKILVKKENAIAHYEDTLRTVSKIDIDTVAPAPPILEKKNIETNKEETTVTIFGENDAKVFIDGKDSGYTIKDHTITVKIPTPNKENTLKITLKDSSNKESETVILNIKNNSVSEPVVPKPEKPNNPIEEVPEVPTPEEPTTPVQEEPDSNKPIKKAVIENIPSITNLKMLNTKLIGEKGLEVFINNKSYGKIPNNGIFDLSLKLDGTDGIKKFNIILKNQKNITSEPLIFSINKDTTPPIINSLNSYNKIENDKIKVLLKGEANSQILINNNLYKDRINKNGEIIIDLPNPKTGYYETFKFEIMDTAGNKSTPEIFKTTFSRIPLDSETTYFIPKDINLVKATNGNEALIMDYGKDQIVGGALAKIVLNENDNLLDKLTSIISSIGNISDVYSPKKLTQQELENKIIAEYTINTDNNIGSIDLISKITTSIFSNNLKDLPSSNSNAIKSNYFSMKLQLSKDIKNKQTYVILSIVPNKQYLSYQSIINKIINSKNIRNNSQLVFNNKEEFIIQNNTINKNADFLFVIDDSGSMSDNQDAISKAGTSFENAIKSAGIKYRVGIITTSCGFGNSYCSESRNAQRILKDVGIIENDIELFKRKIVVGTSGSGTETGIYNAEKALQSIAMGDKEDGVLVNHKLPLKNKPLSIIILSDEESQYTERSEYRKKFDINKNLFLERGYTVHTIVEEGSSNSYYDPNGQYDELAVKTGGLVANIENLANYDSIMNAIAQKAIGNNGYKLTYNNIIASTIFVKINGKEIPYSNENGWNYIENNNTILFYGNAIPNSNDKIDITYSYMK